jgi:hypothetical protein
MLATHLTPRKECDDASQITFVSESSSGSSCAEDVTTMIALLTLIAKSVLL